MFKQQNIYASVRKKLNITIGDRHVYKSSVDYVQRSRGN